jgi:hypothetical protein
MCTICYYVSCTRRSYNKVRGIIVFLLSEPPLYVCIHFLMPRIFIAHYLSRYHCTSCLQSLSICPVTRCRRSTPATNYKHNSCGRLKLFQFLQQTWWQKNFTKGQTQNDPLHLFLNINNFYWYLRRILLSETIIKLKRNVGFLLNYSSLNLMPGSLPIVERLNRE